MGASSSSDSFGSSSSSSNSSGSSSGKRKSGGQWTSQIYFDPEAEKNSGLSHYIGDEELIGKLTTLVDSEEAIETVYAYKVPLNDWQLTSLTMYHLFIIFKTNQWWWSIEKHSDGITIQRSKQLSAVKSRYRQENRRSPISFVKQDSGRKSVEDLIRWLYQANELNKPYHYLTSNCKTFGKRVFGHVAKNENLHWYNGAFS